MAEYLSPAVFIEELSSGIKPIQAVGTSTAAFVGLAERGPVGRAVAIANFGEFMRTFGGFNDEGSLAFAVKAFLDEGGSSCYVVRAAHFAGTPAVSTALPATHTFTRTARNTVRNGLAGAGKISSASGFSDIRIDGGPDNALFLITYVSGTRTLTMTRADGAAASAVLATAAIPAGQTETVSFPTLNGTIVLDSQFNKANSIGLDANNAAVTGTGVIDAATVRITASAGDISAINSTQLALGNLNTPANIGVTSAGGFTGSFDGSTAGVKTVALVSGTNSLTIQFNVTTAFDGGETAGSIDLQHLKNAAVTFKSPAPTLRIDAASPGTWGNELSVEVSHAGDLFNIRVIDNGAPVESIENVSMDPLAPRYVVTAVARESARIAAVDLNTAASALTALERRPDATTAATALTGGNDGLAGIGTTDYVGDETLGNGLHAFDALDDVNIVAVPEAVNRDVHVQGMAYCENRRDCFYVADGPEAAATADEVLNFKLARGLYAGGNALNSKYGALYVPWIRVVDPRTGGRITIPPSGAVAGRYARTDTARGVHKAAAGVTDGRLATAVDLAVQFTAADQEKLNPRGINVIRRFPGTGNAIWGARTVSTDPEWRLLNVRRLFLFLEGSIEASTSWVVFEPNDATLWKAITRNISAFLRLQWLAGALVGATEEQAFYVKCDAETNPPDSVLLGRVITEIGVAPSKPAEFVIFRIAQFQGGSDVSE